ncbi:MAG: hypothetical protein P8M04_12160 [Akkermansiaceae bacterium]|nr:hypothetical protein [Akkermansiaceae bacterium]
MNRKKSTSSLGFSSLVLLGIAVAIVSSSGIGYVIMKNRQISTRSQISEVQSRIQDHHISILLHHSEIEEALGIFQLRQKLKEINSSLTEIDFVEPLLEANEESPPENSVARR